jgi:glutamate 5-kinase
LNGTRHQRLHPQHLQHRRVVVKVGSNVLTAGTDALDAAAMAHLVEQIADLTERGGEMILVTSGAIAAGRHRLEQHRARALRAARRAVAPGARGGRAVAADGALGRALRAAGHVIAQALLTRRDLADRLAT